MDGTPVPCGQSVVTVKRSDLAGYAGCGYSASHSRFYCGSKLMFIVTCDGTITGFALANPKLDGEREAPRHAGKAGREPARPRHRHRGGRGVRRGRTSRSSWPERAWNCPWSAPPSRTRKFGRPFPNWLRRRVEAVIWTLKNQLGLEHHGGCVPAGLWSGVAQRLLALNVAIWRNWMVGAPVKRPLFAYARV